MSRPYRKYAIPSRDAVVTTGEMIVLLPEDDKTGNALAHTPLVEYVWGRPATAAAPPAQLADVTTRWSTVDVVKVAVSYGDKILVIREPDNNPWMPGRLGLPGGKRLAGESLHQCLDRKLQTEVGVPARVTGLYCVYDILMPDKSVVMFIIRAEAQTDQVGTIEGTEAKWVGLSDLERMGKDDFTEYYNDDLIRELLRGVIPTEMLRTQDNRTPAIQKWMDSGRKR